MMFSLDRGKPIAAVCDGRYDGCILHLTEDEEKPDIEVNEDNFFEVFTGDDFQALPGRSRLLSTKSQHAIRRAILRGEEPEDDFLVPAYRSLKEKINERLKKEFNLETGIMFILPDPEPERVFIAGKSGSGKSCLAALYMNEYLRKYPGHKVHLISRHFEEKTYETVRHEAVPLEMFAEEAEGVDMADFANSLVVFDDCDNIADKAISTNIRKLCDDIISNGRKYGIYSLWLNHQLMEYSKTRNLLNEANKVVFFNSGSNYHIQQYLRRYVGASPAQAQRILGVKSRWTMIALTVPQYVLHEHGAFLLT